MYPDYNSARYEFMGFLFVVYQDGVRYTLHESSFSNGIDLLNRYDRMNDGHIYSIMTSIEAREYEEKKAAMAA